MFLIFCIVCPMNNETIKRVRLELGYSQQEFAAAIGVSFATVNRWENGKAKPQKDRIDRIRALSKQKEQLPLFAGAGSGIPLRRPDP